MALIFGAVITAAGMSSRMKDFKQLMKIGGLTFAERVILNFRRIGVSDIAVVTGYRGDELEKSLKGSGAVFLRNKDYETTKMFDSAKIGLSYLRDRCDYLFFCPVDVPFFTEDTLRKEIENVEKGDVIVPYYNEEPGHPLLLSKRVVDYTLSYSGERGMKGAYESFVSTGKGTLCRVLVDDAGAALDADTGEDYEKLLRLHNSRLLHPETRVSISGQKDFFDHDTYMLLKETDTLKSVREACEKCGISYSKGRNTISLCEQELGYSIVKSRQGGTDGGMSELTEEGKSLLTKFETFEREMAEIGRKKFGEIFGFKIPPD